MDLCGACGGYARRRKSPRKALRGRECPKFGHVHRGCCRDEPCSAVDAAGRVRCGWLQLSEAERAEMLYAARGDGDGPGAGVDAGPPGGLDSEPSDY